MSARLERFMLTEQHVALLRRANVRWDAALWGAPCIDAKRPYGNGGMLEDMLELLYPGTHPGVLNEEDSGYRPQLVKDLTALHRQLEVALQVVLHAQTFEPGHYVADPYQTNWRRA
jgi:hypothetical protein